MPFFTKRSGGIPDAGSLSTVVISMLCAGLVLLNPLAAAAGPANRRPVARAGEDLRVIEGEVVTLDGSGSFDPDGDPLTFRWSMASRPNGSGAVLDDPHSPRPSFAADVEGTYRILLTVNDGKLDSRPDAVKVQAVYGELSNPISPDDFRKVASWGPSYLAQNSAGKKLLYLEGTAYQRGYAKGRLCPQAVHRMTHDFTENLVLEIMEDFGIEIPWEQYPGLWNLVWQIMRLLASSNQDAIPAEFRQEMRGISDACRQQGYDVSFEDLVTLNLGYDTLESIYAGIGAIMCNEFTVFGDATTGRGVYHGRDFMFGTGGDVFSDEALLIVQKPRTGYPFVASAAPGFVGIPTGMNARGVSCGMDVVLSIFTRPLVSGPGCLLLCRQAVQYAGSHDEAVSIIRNADRAVPWLYMIADGKVPTGSALETFSSSQKPPEGSAEDYWRRFLIGLLRIILFPQAQNIGNAPRGSVAGEGASAEGRVGLADELVRLVPESARPRLEKGVMVRTADYLDPPWLDGLQLWFRPADSPNPILARFPRQIERHPDLVAMTNHYIIPLMAATYPALLRVENPDSVRRYRDMLRLLEDGYGRIDRLRAMWIIDFLNPGRCDYYGSDRTQSVKGHHVLMDNRTHEMWSLHGYYDDPWVHVDLDDVLSRPFP